MEETKHLRRCLYLDDIRTPTQNIPGYKPWDVVRNYEEFVDYITTNGIPDFISFDHDLADEHMVDYVDQVQKLGFQSPNYDLYKEKTGLDCARFLCEYAQTNGLTIHKCAVHSHNPVGALNIQSYINGYLKFMGHTPDCYMGKVPFVINKK